MIYRRNAAKSWLISSSTSSGEATVSPICCLNNSPNRSRIRCTATFTATSKKTVDPYEVLGVPEGSSDAEVRSAHRRLVRDYHPDVIQSKGLPEDFQAFAAEKLVAVNEAWAEVKTARGL